LHVHNRSHTFKSLTANSSVHKVDIKPLLIFLLRFRIDLISLVKVKTETK
jgi:hypothetical protein